jgi:response regulator RpfG family c-di-GMP phosphodiesterase
MIVGSEPLEGDRHILVVEDEVHVREPLGLLLREHGYDVELAADGEEGLALIESRSFFLVISDISMPRLDGLTLLKHIKEIRPQTDVMIITGNADEENAIQALKRGAYDYFRKPFDFRELLLAVDRVVEKRRLEREALAYQRLRERTEAERIFAVESVNGLVEAVEAKDIYTRGHSERVGTLAGIFGEFLGLDRRLIEQAGRIHDIGKIGIPDGILNKPGRLTEGEYEVIQQHPLIGEKIVLPISVLSDVANIVHHHHEWFDGTGYPDGLGEDEIPVEVRVLSVVDVADAIRHDRAYRPGSGVPEVLSMIKAQAGTQFDPEIVSAFLRLVEERPEVFP